MRNERHNRVPTLLVGLLCLCLPAVQAQTPRPKPTSAPAARPSKPAARPHKPAPPAAPQQFKREGIAVDFQIEPVAPAPAGSSAGLLEGGYAVVRFRITDTTTGRPVTGLHPAAWMDRRETNTPTDEPGCKQKIQSFLQSSLAERADIDLNAYYVLALNHEPNISVIDPLLGFGGSKLLTLVFLKSPGEDWVLTPDRQHLFVSMPLVNQVAVVDTNTWKVTSNIDTGAHPSRLVLQQDGKYLWVGTDGLGNVPGGVTAIDTTTLKPVAQITTAVGHHELALSGDNAYVYVTNQQAGSVSIISVRSLAKVKDLQTGAQPVSLAYSPLSRAVYVRHAADGATVVVDATRREIAAHIQTKPGPGMVRITPDGRYGFIINTPESLVYVFDAATNRLLHTLSIGRAPDQIAFTQEYAYVRSLGTEEVSMIRLSELSKPRLDASVARFPGGQVAPGRSPNTGLAPAIVPAPESGTVLVANPADKIIYYYQEGMAAPMGSFQNYQRDPKSVLVWDASLREAAPGVYTTTTTLTGHGPFDVPFLLDQPRIFNCFQATVAENPALRHASEVAIKVEPLTRPQNLRVGTPVQFRFKVTDADTGRPKSDLKDMGVLTFLAPGSWQQRDWAKSVGDGIYEISFTPPRTGAYYIFFQCPSLRVQYRQLPSVILQAETVPSVAPTAPPQTGTQQP